MIFYVMYKNIYYVHPHKCSLLQNKILSDFSLFLGLFNEG